MWFLKEDIMKHVCEQMTAAVKSHPSVARLQPSWNVSLSARVVENGVEFYGHLDVNGQFVVPIRYCPFCGENLQQTVVEPHPTTG
jgi:hypothetical protein